MWQDGDREAETGTKATMHAVKTRMQSAQERKAEEKVDSIRMLEQPTIKELEQLVEMPVDELDLTVLEEEDGTIPMVDSNGELEAIVSDKVDSGSNLGSTIPSMEIGASLGAEYMGAIAHDDMLAEWKSWGEKRLNGFLWDNGILKRAVERATGSW